MNYKEETDRCIAVIDYWCDPSCSPIDRDMMLVKAHLIRLQARVDCLESGGPEPEAVISTASTEPSLIAALSARLARMRVERNKFRSLLNESKVVISGGSGERTS